MKYRREIDGLRTLAVLPVVFFHAGFSLFGGGFVGVDVFFVISGYLITTIIIDELSLDKFSLLRFYDRRARRILPALLFVVLVCLPLGWVIFLPGDFKEFFESVISVFTFSSNILFWRTSGYFDSSTELKPLLHTWSLAVEEQYYVIFPLFLALFWRFGKPAILVVLGLAWVLSLTLAQWGSVSDPTAAFYLLPTRGWELLTGAGAAFLLCRKHPPSWGVATRNAFSFIGFCLITYAVFFYNKNTPFPGLYAVVPAFGAVFIIIFADKTTLVGKILGSEIFVRIGLISYSTYLWHQPLFAFARYSHGHEPAVALMLFLSLLSLILGYLSWQFVERPFRNRELFDTKKIFWSTGLASLAFIGIGVLGIWTHGFSYRYQGEDKFLASLQKREVGRFVSQRFNSHVMKGFDSSDRRPKILIIGDSFAQDVVNAVMLPDAGKNVQISTRHIGHECGNLFLPREDFAQKIIVEARQKCAGRGIYEDTKLRKLMTDADEVWFVSRWQYWQTDYILQSLNQVGALTKRPVRVFGRKDFGVVTMGALLAVPDAQRRQLSNPVDLDAVRVNAKMRAALDPTIFVDVQALLCGQQQQQCRLYPEGQGLVSYDGGHLTEWGARYLGTKLLAEPGLKQSLVPKAVGM